MSDKVKSIVFVFIFLSACSGHEIKPVIVWKSHHDFFSKPIIPDCICRFGYKSMSNGSATEFEDSCYKYNIGDTIVGH